MKLLGRNFARAERRFNGFSSATLSPIGRLWGLQNLWFYVRYTAWTKSKHIEGEKTHNYLYYTNWLVLATSTVQVFQNVNMGTSWDPMSLRAENPSRYWDRTSVRLWIIYSSLYDTIFRDIKPSNFALRYSDDGRTLRVVSILDFGLAR